MADTYIRDLLNDAIVEAEQGKNVDDWELLVDIGQILRLRKKDRGLESRARALYAKLLETSRPQELIDAAEAIGKEIFSYFDTEGDPLEGFNVEAADQIASDRDELYSVQIALAEVIKCTYAQERAGKLMPVKQTLENCSKSVDNLVRPHIPMLRTLERMPLFPTERPPLFDAIQPGGWWSIIFE